MGLPAKSARCIAAASPTYCAVLTRRVDHTDSLSSFWISPMGRPAPFAAGQYMTIGIEVDGILVQRPYSVANSPHEIQEQGYELYVRRVEGGEFTPCLFDLPIGQQVSLRGPKGKFVFADDGHPRTHLFVSTATGIAPFMSMMKALLADGTPRRTCLIQGVSYPCDLNHRELLDAWATDGRYPLTYIPTVSRPHEAASQGWAGRAGRAEAILEEVLAEQELGPDNTIAYLCGNPGMVARAEATLFARGFGRGAVRKELYWTPRRVK
jgi:ferredoxin-NADP reductase